VITDRTSSTKRIEMCLTNHNDGTGMSASLASFVIVSDSASGDGRACQLPVVTARILPLGRLP
jgi:hypothetical protein